MAGHLLRHRPNQLRFVWREITVKTNSLSKMLDTWNSSVKLDMCYSQFSSPTPINRMKIIIKLSVILQCHTLSEPDYFVVFIVKYIAPAAELSISPVSNCLGKHTLKNEDSMVNFLSILRRNITLFVRLIVYPINYFARSMLQSSKNAIFKKQEFIPYLFCFIILRLIIFRVKCTKINHLVILCNRLICRLFDCAAAAILLEVFMLHHN